MIDYIATFHSHFGALTYFKTLKKLNIPAKLMPVPRKISASCGTCVKYENPQVVYLEGCEVDGIYIVEADETYSLKIKT